MTKIQTPDQVREEKKKQIDEVVEYIKDFMGRYPEISMSDANPHPTEEDLAALAAAEIPAAGKGIKAAGDDLYSSVLRTSQYVHSPGYFAYVPNDASPYSVAGSIMTDVFDVYAGANLFSQSAGIIEKKLISWMAGLIGFPDTAGGVFTSGGSMSTLTGFVAARNSLLDEDEYSLGTAYFSDQAHSSVRKGLMIMGVPKDRMRIIPTDDNFRIQTDVLERRIKEDLDAGLKPFLLVGSLGTTNTGSVDSFKELARMRDKYSMWLHVDGALGGSILFSRNHRHVADGINLVDSLTWDLHKWGLQTYACSCLIARDRSKLISTFSEHPEYLDDIQDDTQPDGWDMGIEMTRPARSLKFWTMLQALGTDKLEAVIDRSLHTMDFAAEQIDSLSDWELTSTPSCCVVTFRYAPAGHDEDELNNLNTRIGEQLACRSDIHLATTVIRSMKVLRISMTNSAITTDDVSYLVQKLQEAVEYLSL